MMLLDSPLNKAGLLNILLENSDGKIIQVNSEFRVPRTWKVFAKVIGKWEIIMSQQIDVFWNFEQLNVYLLL